jgi:hypothetical protein
MTKMAIRSSSTAQRRRKACFTCSRGLLKKSTSAGENDYFFEYRKTAGERILVPEKGKTDGNTQKSLGPSANRFLEKSLASRIVSAWQMAHFSPLLFNLWLMISLIILDGSTRTR